MSFLQAIASDDVPPRDGKKDDGDDDENQISHLIRSSSFSYHHVKRELANSQIKSWV